MEGIALGQYIPGKSIIHRLDPRTKLTASALTLWVVFLLKGSMEYFIFGALIILLYVLAGVLSSLAAVLRPGVFLILITLFLNMIFVPGEKVILSLGLFAITWEGMAQGLIMGIRLLFLILLSSLVTLTTSPVRMTDGLEMLLKPFRRIGVPAGELAMMINIALRFIPTFWQESDRIIKAQVSRGADFESWNIAKRLKYLTALLIPLFISAFRKADELALAMESRGYAVGMERTSLHKLEFAGRDYTALGLVGVLTVLFLGYRFIT